ncbi:MAG TPA: ChbG/HpnK family deacetylase [Rhizomicrobium sp.]
MAPRKIVLCADDYGLSPAVGRGIRELLEMHRLSATSCMVVFPEFAEEGPLLHPFFDRADIGLHFTLTSDRSLPSVMVRGWLRQLDPKVTREELERQLDLFARATGRPPDYIDGHQHVHLLPHVREAVAEAAQRIGAYVRLTREPIDRRMLGRAAPRDSAYLSWASRPLARLAAKRGVHTNTGFRGVRSFKERTPFRELFRKTIADTANGSIVMCHPGHVDEALKSRDPIHRQREEEFAYFAGDDFPRDLEAAGLQLARLHEALA